MLTTASALFHFVAGHGTMARRLPSLDNLLYISSVENLVSSAEHQTSSIFNLVSLPTTVDIFSSSRRSSGNVCLLVGCLTPQQHASVSQGRICPDNCTCCHADIEVADQTFHSPSHGILTHRASLSQH